MQPPPRPQKQPQIELTTSRTPHRAPRNSYKHRDRGRQRQRKRRNMAADTAFLLNIKSQNPSKLEPKNVHRSRKHRAELTQPASGALFGERFDSFHGPPRQNRILSPFLAMWVLFLSPLVWGGPCFPLCFDFFFPAVTGCQHSLHQLEIRNKKI